MAMTLTEALTDILRNYASDFETVEIESIAKSVAAELAAPGGWVEGLALLADEWDRTADECERLSHVRAGLSDERGLVTASLVNRSRAADLRALAAALREDS